MVAKPHRSSFARYAFGCAGFCCVGLAVVGVILPGIPTTPFLLLAGYCFTRSFPAVGKRLINKPIFHPYRPYLVGDQPIPRRAKISATVVMWLMIGLSTGIFRQTDRLSPLLLGVMIVSGLLGTWMVWFWLDRRFKKNQSQIQETVNS